MLHPLIELPCLPVSKPTPLATAIRTLIAGGVAVGVGVAPVRAQPPLPTPTHVTGGLSNTPVNLVQGSANPATFGQATGSVNGNTLTVHQLTNTVTLDWNSFNIAQGSTVNFVQPSASSVALNNIHDSNASQIFGSLTANGQVYLINQNGFVFGPHSQVNVNSLVATTLGISQADLVTGIGNAFTAAFQTNPGGTPEAALQGNGQFYLKNSAGNYVLDAGGSKIPISISIQAGAQITASAAGGLVLIAAPTVNNQGTITDKGGQVILAAATDKVYLQDSNDANLRGMLVEVGTGGQLTNGGAVLAQNGNVSMIGFAVNQNGLASATTSVQLNGSVRLMAEEGIQNPNNTNGILEGLTTVRGADNGDGLGASATVKLGAGSITAVEPENSTATALAAQSQPKSYIEISGHEVEFLNGSLVQAPSGNVNVEAWEQPQALTLALGSIKPVNQGAAEIYMQTGSTIDVSGVQNVAESVANNIVSLKLQSNELRDAPLQRDGILYGQTVSVDIRDANISHDSNGSPASATVPIADIIGPVQAIAANIQQRSTTGGSINLNSSGDVIINNGSTLNFSGGSVAYHGGYVTTTELVSKGQIYNIGSANPNLIYSGLFNQTSYEPGYVQGAAGGSLNITSYAALLNGQLEGQTVNGALQRQTSELTAGSSLSIDLSNGNSYGQQNVVFSAANSGLTLRPGDPFPLLPASASLSEVIPMNINTAMINASGIKNITIVTNGSVTVDQGAQIHLPVNGLLNLEAENFYINGGIDIPSGTVDMQPVSLDGHNQPNSITLNSSALIDVSGLWINDFLDLEQGNTLSTVSINGGSVNLVAEQGYLLMENGSRIAADAGAWQNSNAAVTAGTAGAISLTAATHVANGALSSLILDNNLAGLSAWGLQQDGSLTLKTNQVIIGSEAGVAANALSTQPLVLSPAFFQQGGFSSYNIVSNVYGLTVSNNTQLGLQQRNLELTSAAVFAATGSYLGNIGQPVLLTESQRNPVKLALSFTEITNQNQLAALTIGSGSLIQTDPGGSLTLNSDTSIIDNGVIETPAGNIALNINLPASDNGFFASQGIWLGTGSELLAMGAYVPPPFANGSNPGKVLAGGNVALTADRGYIVTMAGSLINVSGTSVVSDVLQANRSGVQVIAEYIPSAGGSISFTAGEGILADGGLEARSGGGSAAGGNLSVVLNSGLLGDENITNRSLMFPGQLNTGLSSIVEITASSGNLVPVGLAEDGNIPRSYSDRAWLTSGLINAAGFASISLQTDAQLANNQLNSAILFSGNVQLDASRQIILDTPTLESQTTQANIAIDAPYVALGSSLVNQVSSGYQLAPAAFGGSSQFNVRAQGIDLIGGVGFNGFGAVNLVSQGGLRMIGDFNLTKADYLGELNLAGNLNVLASQVYPATLTDYTINITGSSNSVSFGAPVDAASATPILSAGGILTINAPNITQAGNVEAPFGTLILNALQTLDLAAGSVTSVSGVGSVAPFGVVSGGTEWLYPLDSSGLNNIVITASNLPQKSLQLYGQTLNLQQGATVNLAGGGDLYAYEFVPGNGGSNDVLNSSSTGNTQQFAVIPGINSILTPYDPQQYSSSGLTSLGMGANVYLNAAAGLAAGWYTLLPAHYALLPGAYLITPEARTSGQSQTTYNSDAVATVTGYYGVAGTGIQNPVSQGFEVQPCSIFTGSISYNSSGAIVVNSNDTSPSQFNAYLANSFFAAEAAQTGAAVPQLPQDAGNLLIAAANSLTLNASLLAAPAGNGLGGQVDISGENLLVAGNSHDLAVLAPGEVGLLASQLNSFNAPSLLLGGKRGLNSTGKLVTITANNVTVEGDAVLKGQEILLAAMNTVNIADGAQVLSSGNTGVAGRTLVVENSNGGSDGALLRVSSAGQVVVDRDLAITGNGGLLTIGSGAILQADGSMLLDSSQNTVFNGTIAMNGGALALNSSRISLGDAPADTPGLVLASLPGNLNALSFNTTGDFDIYGAVAFNSNLVSISAAAINGFNNAGTTSTITAAGQLDLANNGAVSAHVGTGSGDLVLNAQNIQLGSGQYAITGFQNVTLNASQAIDGQGATIDPATGNSITANPSVLRVAGDLDLNAEQFSGGNGATTTINAGNYAVTLNSPTQPATNLPIGLGVSWTVSGGSIDSSARFDLPSGILNLTATSGDINLNSGAAIDLSGRAVAFFNENQYSPGGNLTLIADRGNVNVSMGATINLSGDIQLNNGADEQLSNAGSLTVQAVNGLFNWNGAISDGGGVATASGVATGNLQLDAASFGSGGFSALNTKMIAAGFRNDLILEQQSGNVTIAVGDTINASQFQLSADQGAVNILGAINVSGATAGSVSIYGENGITLASTGLINASATGDGNAGGGVTLDTLDRNGDGPGAGVLNLSAAGGIINVAGGNGGAGGSVLLRTGRNDILDSVAVTAINTQIIGAAPFAAVLEATRVYGNINAGSSNANIITADNIITWMNDTNAFMNSTAQLVSNIGASLNLPSSVVLMPGIEVRSHTNLTLAAPWDFESGGNGWTCDTCGWNSGWRYGAENLPGFLTLRAAGDLNINASISDGLATTPLPGYPYSIYGTYFQNVIQPGLSWSYNLIAGGNVNLAASYSAPDPLGSGNLVDTQVVVRTGTGSIDIQAGSNIVFNIDNSGNLNSSNDASAVYTVGTAALYTMDELLAGQVPGMPVQQAGQSLQDYLASLNTSQLNQLLRYGFYDETQLGQNFMYAEYPTNGGNINMTSGGSVQGVQTGEQMTDWLVRSGSSSSQLNGENPSPTAWGINISGDLGNSQTFGVSPIDGVSAVVGQDNRNFNQNVGALGGGNVKVKAGLNVNDLSIMIPTTGKPLGVMSSASDGSYTTANIWVQNATAVNGGGNLQVTAGNNIVGGEYYVAKGSGNLAAGSGITQTAIPNSNLKAGVILDLGNGVFNLQARQDINLGAVMNPTLIAQIDPISIAVPYPDPQSAVDTRFFTYGADSAVNLQSTAGNVVFMNDIQGIETLDNLPHGSTDSGIEYSIFPGILNAVALSGDIRIDSSLSLYPSANGALELLAGGNIGMDPAAENGQSIAIIMSDADPGLLPGINNPASALDGGSMDWLNPSYTLYQTVHAATPLHQGDQNQPLIVALHGNISFPSADQASVILPQAANIIAGGNISNLSVTAQNLSATDVTLIQAGGNIAYDTPVDENGIVHSNNQFIQVAGPGQLQVIAGGDINLGSSVGIETVGNQYNPALTQTGASIQVLAGLSNQIDYLGFIDTYQATGAYSAELLGLSTLSTDQQRLKLNTLLDVLFQEIARSASLAATAPADQRYGLYQIGFDAIEALFPGSNYSGNINMVYSQIKTAASGDIDLLAPGGSIDVGLPGNKSASQLGVVVQGQGNLNILSQGDVNVNQSRVFNMSGGNITGWSSGGSIDAGIGARSAISAPAPIGVLNSSGQIAITYPPVISGSGIQAIGGGNVYLAAPVGVVNAGEAGISGHDIVIAATAVIGASNIQATGSTSGVPTAIAVVPVAIGGADSAAASASKSAAQSAMNENNANSSDDRKQKSKVTIIKADVVGYGSCSVGDVRSGKGGCGG